jgi:hypothetical protein
LIIATWFQVSATSNARSVRTSAFVLSRLDDVKNKGITQALGPY